MLRIHILTKRTPWKRGFNDFYPLIKWRKNLKREGVTFHFISRKENKKIDHCDILMLDYRYFRKGSDNWAENRLEAIDYIEKIPPRVKTVWFDNEDGSGTRGFDITPYVDLHLKKQILKDKSNYLVDDGDKSVMCWIPDEYTPSNIPYTPCRKEDLVKLRLGWNIGMSDYRQFPFYYYYPTGTSILLNSLYKAPALCTPQSPHKKLLSSYRGSVNKDTRYSFQRKMVHQVLQTMFESNYRVGYGNTVSKKKYLDEMKRSKTVVSPFGWGEIAHRDFEAFITGSILVKPDMEHLETFPQFFIKDKTYISVDWKLEQLESILKDIDKNYERYLNVALYGQKNFMEKIKDFEAFKSHFFRQVID